MPNPKRSQKMILIQKVIFCDDYDHFDMEREGQFSFVKQFSPDIIARLERYKEPEALPESPPNISSFFSHIDDYVIGSASRGHERHRLALLHPTSRRTALSWVEVAKKKGPKKKASSETPQKGPNPVNVKYAELNRRVIARKRSRLFDELVHERLVEDPITVYQKVNRAAYYQEKIGELARLACSELESTVGVIQRLYPTANLIFSDGSKATISDSDDESETPFEAIGDRQLPKMTIAQILERTESIPIDNTQGLNIPEEQHS